MITENVCAFDGYTVFFSPLPIECKHACHHQLTNVLVYNLAVTSYKTDLIYRQNSQVDTDHNGCNGILVPHRKLLISI